MLRLRKTDGSLSQLTADDRFIEICSTDGRVAAVLYQDDAGTIHQIGPKDVGSIRYSELFNVKFCDTIEIQR